MNTATRPSSAVDPDAKEGEVVVHENPRQAAIDAMTARMEQSRQTELDEAIAADPGLAAHQAELDNAIEVENAEARERGELPALDPDGAHTRQAMHPADDKAPASKDPLSEFVVMQKGVPMFQVKVNGQTQLIPLDQAKRQIQIGVAAETRMKQASIYETNTTRALDARERALTVKEQALLQRTQAQPAVPAQADLSEADLLDEAREIFSTAFSGTEEDAARKLARVLTKIRSPGVSPAAPIDEAALISKATRAAVNVLKAEGQEKDVLTGYERFQKDYPDIMADPQLYKMADDMTDEIEKENPQWLISQVMDEAGKRTRAWVENITGKAYVMPEPAMATKTPVNLLHPTQVNRQERKQGLVKIPAVAAGAVHQTPVDEPEHEQTPSEALAQLKAARGQPN